MKNSEAPLDQTHFRYLRTKEIENPISFINEFCGRETELCYFRQDVLDLLKTAYSYKEEFYTGASPSHGYCQQQLIRLIEAIYVLTTKDVSVSRRTDTSLAHDYRLLNTLERREIRLFLNDFFEYKDLDNWREYLDDILIHAYKEGNVGYFEYDKTPFKSMDMLGKFTEAVFLIYEITSTARTEPVFRTPSEKASSDGENDKEGDNMDKDDNDGLDEELPNRLHEEVFQFFSLIDPRFIGEGLRHILMVYLREGFDKGFGREAMLAELMYPLQRLFELFDVARRETSHWGDMRIGCDFVN